MAKHKLITMLQRRLRNTWKFCYGAIAKRLRKLLRPVFLAFRRAFGRRSNARAGFVLPTAALLLLVVSLVIGAMLIRTFNRTDQVIGQRQEKVIYNSATPAIDRAKAKVEYLFNNDPRLPAGVPSEKELLRLVLNEDDQHELPNGENPYRIPDETPLDLNEDGTNDSAWKYPYDSDGDGTEDTTIAYSIIWQVPDNNTGGADRLQDLSTAAVGIRANNLEVRHGPLSAQGSEDCELEDNDQSLPIEEGWLKSPNNTASLIKNFQINAVAIPDEENGTVATLEVQQERQADRGNKWGAWFRYDLEIAPGQPFNWNGAMHTDGSLFLSGPDRLTGYLVSSHNSCIYQVGRSTSEITVYKQESDAEDADYEGQVVSGNLGRNTPTGRTKFHLWQDGNIANEADVLAPLNPDTDSVRDGISPDQIALDPIALFTNDTVQYRGGVTKEQIEDPGYQERPIRDRIFSNFQQRPNVDDFYRADNRFGPKPSYGQKGEIRLDSIELGGPFLNGQEITGMRGTAEVPRPEATLTTLNPEADLNSDDARKDIGLDGYWERRAWREGTRILMGPRLELGNDPLPVPTGAETENLDIPGANALNNGREHETLQRRAGRDNPAAVQATAIYDATGGGNPGAPPVAAVVTTVHPGTADTLKRSATFDILEEPVNLKTGISDYQTLFNGQFGDNEVIVDFLTGRGTNGLEFEIPPNYISDVNQSSTLLRRAVENLANFSGDPDGAFPPTTQNDFIHPYPQLAKWGNFSNLRRSLNAGNGSLADESYKHTSALTMGMLAYNLSYLNGFDYENPANQTALDRLDEALQILDNRICDRGYYPPATSNPDLGITCPNTNPTQLNAKDGIDDGEVVYYPSEDLNRNGTLDNGEDFDGNGDLKPAVPTMVIYAPGERGSVAEPPLRVTPGPEAYIRALELRVEDAPTDVDRIKALELARLIVAKEQVARDRKFGFRPTLFGIDTTAQTLDSYIYQVQHIYNEDFNGDNQLNDGGSGTADVTEFGTLAFAQQKLPGNVTRDSLIPLVEFDFNGDSVLDSEDFNRNGIFDLFVNENLNGSGGTTEETFNIGNYPVVENADGVAALSNDVPNGEERNTSDSIVFGMSGALQGIPLTSGGVNEASLVVNGQPVLNPATGNAWDIDLNGSDTDTAVTDLSEDLDDNGMLDVFRHRGVTYDKGVLTNPGCDFSNTPTGNNFFGFGTPNDPEQEARFIRLATSLCSTQPKYPALYYIFPTDEHGHRSVAATTDLNGDGTPTQQAVVTASPLKYDEQPLTDLSEDVNFNGRLDPGEDTNGNSFLDGETNPYVDNDYILGVNPGDDLYEPFVVNNTQDEIASIAIAPQNLTAPTILPYINAGASPPSECNGDTTNGPNPNCSQTSLIYHGIDNLYYRAPFKDSAFFNGREMMQVRALNIDLEMLVDNGWIAPGDDSNFIDGGIVYAFREDAVREDGILRPSRLPQGACDSYEELFTLTPNGAPQPANLRCFSDATQPQDPPLPENLISLKPVDFYPDPDRRPYGFRLMHGEDISRDPNGGTTEYGLTFVSDNPGYVQGDFNCHGDCNNPVEEFTQTLIGEDWGFDDFYLRRRRTNYDNFANPDRDSWRPSEFLVDALTILSDNFCEGSNEDGFVSAGPAAAPTNLGTLLSGLGRAPNGSNLADIYGCPNAGESFSSYLNQNRPQNNVTESWLRENPADPGSPIQISPNGNPILASGGDYQGNYFTFEDNAPISGTDLKPTNQAQPQQINAGIFSGIPPSQGGQTYGGLHNFPRFIENWFGVDAFISGAFYQLNFSTYATGPFDQDAWEPGQSAVLAQNGGNLLNYYGAPNRRWGYDVALQLVPPGPITSRLTSPGGVRSEFYRELPVDDPYIEMLKKAAQN